MKRGPRPKPTVLKKLHGTFNVTRDRDRLEPLAPGELAAAPAHLTEAQKARWAQVLRDAPKNVLRRIDREALVAYIVAGDLVERANTAQQALDAGKPLPFLAKSDKGLPTLSPYVKLMLRAVPMMLRAAAECGFTPTARAGMKIYDGALDDDLAEIARWQLVAHLSRHHSNGNAEEEKRWRQEADRLERLMNAKPASARPQ